MINLNFNSLCPFCSSNLIIDPQAVFINTKYLCETCPKIHNLLNIKFYYNSHNIINYLLINNEYNTKSINIDFFSKMIFNPNTQHIPLQDFDSIQDLLDIINVYLLFK